MSTVNPLGALTFTDLAKYNKGETRIVIDTIAQRNDIYSDMVIKPANNGDTEDVELRTDIAKANWTGMYRGTRSSKGARAKFRATCAMLSTKMELDKRIADKQAAIGNLDAWMKEQIEDHVDAMQLEVAMALIYGRVKDNPLAFNGIARHFNAYGSNDSRNPAYNVISAGGTDEDSLGSIYLVGWGTRGTYCICPQFSKSGGIRIGEMKEVDLEEPEDPSATYEGLRKYFYQDLGLVMADWRPNGRVCNINRLAHQTEDGEALKALAIKNFRALDTLTGRCARRGDVKKKLYMDLLVWEQFKVCAGVLTRTNAIKEEDLNGHTFRTLNGIEVRINECQEVDELYVPSIG
jgi:hypothetical protein